MISKTHKIKAILAIVTSSTIIGLSYAFVKTGLRWGSPLDLLADRLLAASIILLLLRFLGFIKIEKLNKRMIFGIIGVSLFYPIGMFMFQILGVQLIPTSETSIIYATLPIFTLLASAIFLKEKTTSWQKIGIVFSVGGVLYITLQSLNSVSVDYLGYLFILCSLLSMVFYFIFIKKLVQKTSIITITYYLLLYAALIVNVSNIFRYGINGNLANYILRFQTVDYIFVILYLGILSTLVTSFFTNYSLKYLPASMVSVFNNLSPIIGLFAGVVILHEKLHMYYIYGGIIVLIGLIMNTIGVGKNRK